MASTVVPPCDRSREGDNGPLPGEMPTRPTCEATPKVELLVAPTLQENSTSPLGNSCICMLNSGVGMPKLCTSVQVTVQAAGVLSRCTMPGNGAMVSLHSAQIIGTPLGKDVAAGVYNSEPVGGVGTPRFDKNTRPWSDTWMCE